MLLSKKTAKTILYTLLAIDAFLIGALLMIALSTAMTRSGLPAAGRTIDGEARPTAAGSHLEAGTGGSPVMKVSAKEPSIHFFPLAHNFPAPPFLTKNVIVFIGDGMGLEHVKAGGMYANGAPGTLPFESFAYHGLMSTGSSSGLTDSAAAATAMATGYKVDNRVVSMAIPGNGRSYRTLLEYARMHEMSTGLVTTTPITDATPASFGAHTESRSKTDDIAQDYLRDSQPNVLFGGGADSLTQEQALEAGYTVITNRDALLALDTEVETQVSGQFGAGYIPYELEGLGDQPHLSEMTAVALRILDNDPDGFFVMIEGGRIDTASHNNETVLMVGEVAEFGRSVQAALDWSAGRDDTLIIVLSDHETGGLQVIKNNGQGAVPDVLWTTKGHRDDAVGVWAHGLGIQDVPNRIDNTQIPALLTAGAFFTR